MALANRGGVIMAYTTVQDLFTGICDSIRAKEKTTALINHQDIPARIANLPTSSTCEIKKIAIENSSDQQSIMDSLVNTDTMEFFLQSPYGGEMILSGKMVTLFIMLKYYDDGEYYSFWIGGSATRGGSGYASIGAIPWYVEGASSPNGRITFYSDGRVSVSMTSGGNLYLAGEGRSWFIDIAGIAVSYDEGRAPSLGS